MDEESVDELALGRTGHWTKRELDEMGLDKIGMDEVGVDKVAVPH